MQGWKKSVSFFLLAWLLFPAVVNTLHTFLHDHSGHGCENERIASLGSDEDCPICDQILAQFFTPGVTPHSPSSSTISTPSQHIFKVPDIQTAIPFFHLRAPPSFFSNYS